jgi:hypothetical protein
MSAATIQIEANAKLMTFVYAIFGIILLVLIVVLAINQVPQ